MAVTTTDSCPLTFGLKACAVPHPPLLQDQLSRSNSQPSERQRPVERFFRFFSFFFLFLIRVFIKVELQGFAEKTVAAVAGPAS